MTATRIHYKVFAVFVKEARVYSRHPEIRDDHIAILGAAYGERRFGNVYLAQSSSGFKEERNTPPARFGCTGHECWLTLCYRSSGKCGAFKGIITNVLLARSAGRCVGASHGRLH